MKISELIHEHEMTLKNSAMVCKAGDWPDDSFPMPESEDVLSDERIQYAVKSISGHREHVTEVVDAAQAATWDEGLDAARTDAHYGYGAYPSDNPYR